jgi:hypothetical protein
MFILTLLTYNKPNFSDFYLLCEQRKKCRFHYLLDMFRFFSSSAAADCQIFGYRIRTFTILFLDNDSVGTSNDDRCGHVTKQPMVDDTNDLLNVLSHFTHILDGFCKVQVDDVIAVIGDCHVVAITLVVRRTSHSQNGFASLTRRKCRNLSHGMLMTERCDFNRDRETRTETVR